MRFRMPGQRRQGTGPIAHLKSDARLEQQRFVALLGSQAGIGQEGGNVLQRLRIIGRFFIRFDQRQQPVGFGPVVPVEPQRVFQVRPAGGLLAAGKHGLTEQKQAVPARLVRKACIASTLQRRRRQRVQLDLVGAFQRFGFVNGHLAKDIRRPETLRPWQPIALAQDHRDATGAFVIALLDGLTRFIDCRQCPGHGVRRLPSVHSPMPATSGTVIAATASRTAIFHRPRRGDGFPTLPATVCKRASQPAEGLFDGFEDGVCDMGGNRAARKKPEVSDRPRVREAAWTASSEPQPVYGPIPPARFMKPEWFHHQCGLMSTKRGGKAANLYSKEVTGVNARLAAVIR